MKIAKFIHYYTTIGYRYQDMIVCCGEFEKYREEIEDCFEKLDIPCYIDSSVTADNTILSKFIFAFFNVILTGYGKEALLALLTSPLLRVDGELIDKCQKFSVDNIYKYKKYIEKDFYLANILTRLEKLSNAKDFEALIKEICLVAEEGYQSLKEKMIEKSYLKEEKINEQAADSILQTIELISKYNSDISIDEYFKALKLLLSFKELSSVPTFCDAVMVGDGQEGYFDESKIVFIIGCQGLPVINNDNGLLNDDDIALNFIDKKIEPTIRMINSSISITTMNSPPGMPIIIIDEYFNATTNITTEHRAAISMSPLIPSLKSTRNNDKNTSAEPVSSCNLMIMTGNKIIVRALR